MLGPLVAEWGLGTCQLGQAEAEMEEGHSQGLVEDSQGRVAGLGVQPVVQGRTVVLHWMSKAEAAHRCLAE